MILKIKPIILAAGISVRFGENKLLYEIDSKPMYRHILDIMYELYKEDKVLEPLTVINNEKIQSQLDDLNYKYIVNENSINGLSTSIQKGLENIQLDKETYVMFFTADQPFIKKESIEEFIDNFKSSKKPLGCVYYGEVSGNPCIFSKLYTDDLMKLQGDLGGKKVIHDHMDDVYFYNISTSLELEDIDTKNDLQEFKKFI